MSSCARQLSAHLDKNLKLGPVHVQTVPRGQAPTPLVPMSLSTGENFVSHLLINFRVSCILPTGSARCEHVGVGKTTHSHLFKTAQTDHGNLVSSVQRSLQCTAEPNLFEI